MNNQENLRELIKEIVKIIAGENAYKVYSIMDFKEETTDEVIASKTKLKLNDIRKILYRFYDARLAEFRRIRDKDTGWFMYLWRLKTERIINLTIERLKSIYSKLKTRLDYEQKHHFFRCGSDSCLSYTFDEALENNFKCPECNKEMRAFDNTPLINKLSEEVSEIEIVLQKTPDTIDELTSTVAKLNYRVKVENATKDLPKGIPLDKIIDELPFKNSLKTLEEETNPKVILETIKEFRATGKKSKDSIPFLIDILQKSFDWDIQHDTVELLIQMNYKESLPSLLRIFRDTENENLLKKLIQAFFHMDFAINIKSLNSQNEINTNEPMIHNVIDEVLLDVLEHFKVTPPLNVKNLKFLLRSNNLKTKLLAILIIGKTKYLSLFDNLLRNLSKDEHWLIREASNLAITEFGSLGIPKLINNEEQLGYRKLYSFLVLIGIESTDYLLEIFNTEKIASKNYIATILRKANQEIISKFLNLIEFIGSHESHFEKFQRFIVVDDYSANSLFIAIIEALKISKTDNRILKPIDKLLHDFKVDPQLIPYLHYNLNSDDEYEKYASLWIITKQEKLTKNILDILINHIDNKQHRFVKFVALDILFKSKIKNKKFTTHLVDFVRTEDDKQILKKVIFESDYFGIRSLPILIAALCNDDASVINLAQIKMLNFGPEIIPKLIKLLQNEDNKTIKLNVLDIFAKPKLQTTETINQLIFAMSNDGYAEVRLKAIKILGRIGTEKAIRVLVNKYNKEIDIDIRQEIMKIFDEVCLGLNCASGKEVLKKFSIKTAFISYSWDSENHKNWVQNLANSLLSENIDVKLDEFDVVYGEFFTDFMNTIEDCDYTLMIFTENYNRKLKQKKGGVEYERKIIDGLVLRGIENRRIVPIIREKSVTNKMSVRFSARKYLSMYDDDKYEEGIKQLVNHINKVK